MYSPEDLVLLHNFFRNSSGSFLNISGFIRDLRSITGQSVGYRNDSRRARDSTDLHHFYDPTHATNTWGTGLINQFLGISEFFWLFAVRSGSIRFLEMALVKRVRRL